MSTNNNLVSAPIIQTCEVYQNNSKIGITHRVPIPIIDKQVFGEKMAIQLTGGSEIIREPSKVTQTFLNGTKYIWYNPETFMKHLITSNNSSSYMRKFSDGGYEAHSHGSCYVWGAPTVRSILDRPHKKINFVKSWGELVPEVTLNYSSPHRRTCICRDCAESPVKPVFSHAHNCKCRDCNFIRRDPDSYDEDAKYERLCRKYRE